MTEDGTTHDANGRFPKGTPVTVEDDVIAYAEPLPTDPVVATGWRRVARWLWLLVDRKYR